MKVNDNLEFSGVLKQSDDVDLNHCSFTKECLENAYKEYIDSGRPLLGAIFRPDLPVPLSLNDVAFEVKNLTLNSMSEDEYIQLEAKCVPLETHQGKKLKQILEYERNNQGTCSIGMCVQADDTEEKNGVTIVKKCKIERVSVIIGDGEK